ncbi:MucBP domain-containing protein [Lactiplantibacillus nangangensis]|uniref:MucBP domain-containing protein n=2 Tax=Lactiplantibacillus nangangensis TaxID=2559917 RepID=A0ABW1SMF1_9LACO
MPASAASTASETASAASSTASTATSATGSTASSSTDTTPAVPDSTVVTFGDPAIAAAVQKELGVTGPVTVGDIRNFKGSTFTIAGNNLTVTGTLAGLQCLQFLPKTTLISMDVNFASPNIDLTPLIPLRFSMVTVDVTDMSAVNLAPLTEIDPSQISQVNLISCGSGDAYQQNSQGMTNAQLAQLAPWLTAIDNNDVTRPGGLTKYFDFSDGSLTDFSPLKGFTKPVTIAAGGQSQTINTVVNFVTGQPATFTATPITGVEGEDLTSHYENTWNGTDISKAAATETPLVSLGNHNFEIPAAYAAQPGANWFAYGFRGAPFTLGNTADYLNITYPSGVQLLYDSMIFQAAYWQSAPSITATFEDTTGQAIEPEVQSTSPKIGDAFDFTAKTTVPGYTLLPEFSSATSGTYSQNPQYLNYRFERDAVVAGGITMSYVDPDGEPIVPPEQISGDVGDSYTAKPVTIGNYVFKQVTTDSAATSGTLPLQKESIVYEYDPITVTRVINYLDAIANKNIGSTTLTVPYQSTMPDPTAAAIASYEAKGYQLVSNGYPTDGSSAQSAALIKSYRVLFTHQLVALKPGDTLPAGVILTHNVTQNIAFKYPDGTVAAPNVVRQVAFVRNAVRDAITGETTYTAWRPVGTTTFEAVTAPTIANYQPDLAEIPAVSVTGDSADLAQTVTYAPKTGRITVDYYLARTAKALKPSAELVGDMATPYDAVAPAITGYHLVTNEAPTITGHYDDPAATVAFYYEPDAVAPTSGTTTPTSAAAAPTTTSTVVPVTPDKQSASPAVSPSQPVAAPVSTTKPSAAGQPSASTPVAMTIHIKPVRTQIRLAPPVRQQLSAAPATKPATNLVVAAKLPQTSEQRPTNIWGILALTTIGLFGAIRLRREH